MTDHPISDDALEALLTDFLTRRLGSANDKVRVSNIQRENAVMALRNAAGEGRLSFDELNERVPAALTVITRGDLMRLLDDLVPASEMDDVIADPRVLGEGPGFQWSNPLFLEMKSFDSVGRLGAWDVPPFIEIINTGGSVYLNFIEARPLADLIDIALVSNAWMGSFTFVVPEGWGVDTSGITASGASPGVSSRVRTRPSPGNPRIMIRGLVTGQVTVRHPSGRDTRRAAKALAKQAAERPAIEA